MALWQIFSRLSHAAFLPSSDAYDVPGAVSRTCIPVLFKDSCGKAVVREFQADRSAVRHLAACRLAESHPHENRAPARHMSMLSR